MPNTGLIIFFEALRRPPLKKPLTARGNNTMSSRNVLTVSPVLKLSSLLFLMLGYRKEAFKLF